MKENNSIKKIILEQHKLEKAILAVKQEINNIQEELSKLSIDDSEDYETNEKILKRFDEASDRAKNILKLKNELASLKGVVEKVRKERDKLIFKVRN